MPDDPQNNILITQDGQACLSEFGIAGAFRTIWFYSIGLRTLRYLAPERILQSPLQDPETSRPSKEGDVYSLVMTSFSVRSSVARHPTA